MRRFLALCVLLLILCACTTTQKVVDNTFSSMGDSDIVVSKEYRYLGEMRSYYKSYRVNSNMPSGQSPMDSSVFLCDERPRRLLLISRRTSSRGWGSSFGSSTGGNFVLDGVPFKGWIWRNSQLADEKLDFLSGQGYDLSGSEWYKHRLMRTVSRNDLFDIWVYVERGELESEEWAEIKPYVTAIVKSSLTVVEK